MSRVRVSAFKVIALGSIWVTGWMAGGPSIAGTASSPEVTELPASRHLNWYGVHERRVLGDDSVLSEYAARSDALDSGNAILGVGFVPRFACTPVIGIRFGGELAAAVESFYGDGSEIELSIDGESRRWPLLLDADGTGAALWFDGDVAARRTLRRLIDGGSRAMLSLPSRVSVSFSLLGSRRSVAETESACRAHEPPSWRR